MSNKSHWFGVVGCVLALGANGCSSDPATSADAAVADAAVAPDSSGPVPTPVPEAGPPPDAGAECTTLANTAPVVSKTSHPEPTPTMTGGAIADGKYHLTAMDKYNGKTGNSPHQETWQFVGGNVEIATAENGNLRKFAGKYAVAGNVVTLSLTCPMTGTLKNLYTATPTELRVVNADDANEVHTFTKQP